MLFNTTRRPPDPKHEAHNHMDEDVSTDGAVYDNHKSQNQSQSMVDMRMLGSHSMCAVLSAARGSEGRPCAQPASCTISSQTSLTALLLGYI